MMKKLSIALMLSLLASLVMPLHASATEPIPPLLDRQLFFGDADISGAQISPDGRYLTFMRPHQGVRNLWIKSLGAPFDQARPLTDHDRPIPGYFWSQDARVVLFLQDRDGDENYHLWAVDPAADSEDGRSVPSAHDLTDLANTRVTILALPEQFPDEIILGLNDRDPALHDVYRLNLRSGERKLLVENRENILGWVVDHSGTPRLAVRQTEDGGTETLSVKDGQVGQRLAYCSWEETCSPLGFHADNQRVWFLSNSGANNDLAGLFLMDAASGELEFIERDPEAQVDLNGIILSRHDQRLLATVYTGDRRRIYPQDERFAEALAFLREQLPDGEISFSPQTLDDGLVIVSLSRDVNPGAVYLFDWKQSSLEKLYDSRPELPADQLAHMQPLRYKSRDDLEIPAYLTLPRGVEARNLPLVALIHGGPWARDTWGYNALAQFLANRGYAVLQPNFRSSTGYGKAFLNAGNNEWGQLMQDDITWGVRHLIEQGTVNAGRVCIMGGSYGGYATLAGLTFTPELYACGVDIVGPSNLITLLESIPPYWGPMRQIFTLRMGDPDTEEGRAQLERQSPLNHADKIVRPLLVIQGANDPRVKQAESDQIVEAMHAAGLDVEYLVAPDEGHGFAGRENRLAMYTRIEAFLAQHLGGRHQADMSDEIAARLAAITVDPASVHAPRPSVDLEAARSSALPPSSASRIALGQFQYDTRLDMSGHVFEMQMARDLRLDDSGEQLIITSDTTSSMGAAGDQIFLTSEGLLPIRRTMAQGPVAMEIHYQPDQVTGSISGAGELPIALTLDAPVFGEDAGLEGAILGLELNEQFSAALRIVEYLPTQRVRYFRLEADGRETLQLGEHEIEARRLQLQALDGEGGDMTLWVSAELPRVLLRTAGRLPAQMGGGSYVTELSSGLD